MGKVHSLGRLVGAIKISSLVLPGAVWADYLAGEGDTNTDGKIYPIIGDVTSGEAATSTAKLRIYRYDQATD